MHHDESMARRDKTRDRDNKAHTHTHMIHTYLPQVYQKIEMKFERCGNYRSRNLTCKFGTSTHQVEGVNSIENALIASLRTIFGCRLSTLAAPVTAGNRSAFAG